MPRLSWPTALALAAIGAALLIVTVIVPELAFDTPTTVSQAETVRGTVTRIIEERTEPSLQGDVTYRRVEVRVDGHLVVTEQRFLENEAIALDVDPGDEVLLEESRGPQGEPQYFIVDHVRETSLLLLALAFAVLVLLVGRWRGFLSLLGLGASLLVIVRFVLPGILSGADPVLVSVIGAVVIMLATLYLAHGVTLKTSVALVSTVTSLALTAALAQFGIWFAELSGLADEEVTMLQIYSEGAIDAGGLLLSGIVIGALGVLDDVTITQASAVFELRRANPALSARELYGRGMNVGRDHIASTVNTLVLAYAGASLPLLALLALQPEPLGTLLNREFLSTEIVRTLVGSLGIVAAVPLTTGIAAFAVERSGTTEAAPPDPQ